HDQVLCVTGRFLSPSGHASDRHEGPHPGSPGGGFIIAGIVPIVPWPVGSPAIIPGPLWKGARKDFDDAVVRGDQAAGEIRRIRDLAAWVWARSEILGSDRPMARTSLRAGAPDLSARPLAGFPGPCP